MRRCILFVLLTCCLASASLSHAAPPPQTCTPPPPDSHLTPAQQQLAAEGFRLACESANAYKPKKDSDSAGELDEYIPDTPAFIALPTAPNTSGPYEHWIRARCSDLDRRMRPTLLKLGPDDQLIYLKSIYDTVLERRQCI